MWETEQMSNELHSWYKHAFHSQRRNTQITRPTDIVLTKKQRNQATERNVYHFSVIHSIQVI